MKLPQDVQELVAAGRIPAAVAREIAQLATEAEQREMVARFFAEGLTSDAAAKVKGEKKSGGKSPAADSTRKAITLAPGTTVVFTSKKKHTNREIAGDVTPSRRTTRKRRPQPRTQGGVGERGADFLACHRGKKGVFAYPRDKV